MENLMTSIKLPREIAAELALIAMKRGKKKNEIMVEIMQDFIKSQKEKIN